MNGPKISRRDFIKSVGIGGAALSASWLLDGGTTSVHASSENAGPTWGMLIDLTRCVGCDSCALACKESNNLSRPGDVPNALSTNAFTFVAERAVHLPDGEAATRYVKQQCMHCLDAACVAACPAAAMYKGENGPVVYRSYRCLGCRYCQAACPFGVPRFDWENPVTPVIHKCQMCYHRLQEGDIPACVEACPAGALRFASRDELLIQARAKIATNPDRYISHVFGEHEVGGTSVLYLSDIPFEDLGFPANLPQSAPPEETEKIVSKLPLVLGGMTALMAGTAFYTHRKPNKPVGERHQEEPEHPVGSSSDGQEE